MSYLTPYLIGLAIGFGLACYFMHHVVYLGQPTHIGMAIDDFRNIYRSMRRHGHGRLAAARKAWGYI